MLSLERCDETRQSLINLYPQEDNNYIIMLKTLRAFLYLKEIGAAMSEIAQKFTILGWIPDVETGNDEVDVAAGYAKAFASTPLKSLLNLSPSIFNMVTDLNDLICEGAEPEIKEPTSTFKKLTFNVKRMLRKTRSTQTANKIEFIDLDIKFVPGRKVYKKINGGLPMFVFSVFINIMKPLLSLGSKLKHIPWKPARLIGKILESQALRKPVDIVDSIIEKLDADCDNRGKIAKGILFVIKALEIIRIITSVLGFLSAGSNPIHDDTDELNETYDSLFTEEIPSCNLIPYDVPDKASEFYREKKELVDTWIQEANSARRLQVSLDLDEFDEEIAEVEEYTKYYEGFSSAFEKVQDFFQNLMIDHFPEDLDNMVFKVFVNLPRRLEKWVNNISGFTKAMEVPAAIIYALDEIIPEVPEPFGIVGNLVEDAICEVIEINVGRDVCQLLEEFFENLIDGILELFDIGNLPEFEELFEELNVIDQFVDLLDIDDEGLFDFKKYVPEGLQLDYGNFFNISMFDESFENFLTKINKSPADVMIKYLQPPAKYTESVARAGASIIDSTIVNFTCQDGWTPITVKAKYFGSACEQDLTGALRFACEEGVSTCSFDVSSILTCSLPPRDEVINDHLGLFNTKISLQYYCFETIEDWKITPDLVEGITDVKLFKNRDVPSFSRDGFKGDNNIGNDYTTELLKFQDSFIRDSWTVEEVETGTMECSSSSVKPFVFYNKELIDPCINGYRFQNTKSSLRKHWGASEICGYKILFDEGKIKGCTHGQQTFVGQQRTSASTRTTYYNKAGLQIDDEFLDDVCWTNPNVCSWTGSNNACEIKPGTSWEIDWATLATNIEICEIQYHAYSEHNVDGIKVAKCPFHDYIGLVYDPTSYSSSDCSYKGCTSDVCVEGFKGYEACVNDESSGSLAIPYSPGKVNINDPANNDYLFKIKVENRIEKGDVSRTWNYAYYADCNDRQEMEEHLKMDESQTFPSPNNRFSPNRAYDEWVSAALKLQDDCAGNGKLIEQCLSDGSCNLKNFNCLPHEYLWTCFYKPDDSTIRRSLLFGQTEVDVGNTELACDAIQVEVDGSNQNIFLELELISVTEGRDLASWNDITQQVSTYCGVGPNVSSCVLSSANAPDNTVWEVDWTCRCPAGFQRNLNYEGNCVPCEAGSARADGISECLLCAAGSFSGPASSTCSPCPAGTFQDVAGQSDCSICPVATYSLQGSVGCEVCPSGTYQGTAGSDKCNETDAGYYQPDSGSGIQLPCKPGTFSLGNTTECTKCPKGTASFANASDSCVSCKPGSYSRLSGQSSCTYCPQGYYTETYNTTICSKCPDGLFTLSAGASNIADCVDPIDADLLEEIRTDGSSPEFNVDETEMVPLNDLNYSEPLNVSTGCRALLKKYIETNDKEGEDYLMAQIRDGYCNSGPWNTKACGWDGGDCCPQTCQIVRYNDDPDEKVNEQSALLSRKCFWQKFECLDPDTLTSGTVSSRCESLRRRERRVLKDRPNARSEFLLAWNKRLHQSQSRRALALRLNDNIGDGLCHPEFNNNETNYDDGDCCPSTCKRNPALPDSCSDASFYVPVGKTCANGYGCCDPLVNERTFSSSDIVAPTVKVPANFSVECNSSEAEDYKSMQSSPFTVAVRDNDPCFDSNSTIEFMKTIVTREPSSVCGGSTERIDYVYTAEDRNGNRGSTTLSVFIKDTLSPTIIDCPQILEFNVEAGQEEIQLPSLNATDKCFPNTIPASYAAPNSSLVNIQGNIMSRWQKSSFEIKAEAYDPCGNIDECSIQILLLTEEPSFSPSTSMTPSVSLEPSMKSEAPSSIPSNSISPSSDPSSNPSRAPSAKPSSEPSAVPSKSSKPSRTPSVGPSLSVYPSDIPSAGPSFGPTKSSKPSDAPSAGPSLSGSPSSPPSVTLVPSTAPSKGKKKKRKMKKKPKSAVRGRDAHSIAHKNIFKNGP